MTDATSATSATPTAVFVHGAWADASGFGGVIRALGDPSDIARRGARSGRRQRSAGPAPARLAADASNAYFNEVDKGGHFAAWEQPQLFSEEVRAAFRSLR